MEEILTKLDTFLQWSFPAKVQETVNVSLLWIGFAYLVGLITSLCIPVGKWRQSPFIIILVGLTGSCTGFLAVTTWRKLENFNPFSPAGLIISILAAVAALFLYRLSTLLFPGKTKGQDE